MDQRLILDRYRPLDTLGEGGHGFVTLAFDTRMARRVAVKRIPLPVFAGSSSPGLEEARTAAMLNHPSVVTVHEWDTDGEEAFVIMEYLDGVDLGELLDEFGPLDVDEAAAVLEPVAHALVYAHENGVLHLDVKPENVIVTRDGRAKVTDFGIAALTGIGGTASTAGGTLGYMPLEQLRGQELDERADQWAFAALAFEILADAVPFAADTVEGAVFKAEYTDMPLPSEFEPGLPAAVDDILSAALDPDPDQRYQDVATMAGALFDQLGDADAGCARLAGMVEELAGEKGGGVPSAPLGLWDRLAPYSGRIRRVVAAVLCGWLTWAGLLPMDLGPLPTVAAIALVAAAAAGAPALGLALGLIVLSTAFFLEGILTGVVFTAAATAYWVWIGRSGQLGSFAPIAAPFFGMASLGLAPPLLIGFLLEPLAAAGAAGWAAGALHLASAVGGGGAPLLDVPSGILLAPWMDTARVDAAATIFSSPGPLIMIAGWALAAAVVSFLARNGTRGGAAAGSVFGILVLLGAYGVWALFDPAVAVDSGPVLEHLAGSLILVTVVIGLGAPLRGGPT